MVCGYSWSSELIVWSKDGRLFATDNPDIWDVSEVTQDEALAMMADFEGIKNEY